MYCSACGEAAKGKFCWKCGAEFQGAESSVIQPISGVDADWADEYRYEVLVKIPEIRQRIAAESEEAIKSITAEEFLQLGDKALSSFTGGVPISKVAMLAQPIYSRLGIKTGGVRSTVVVAPVGKTIVAVLCSLARSSQTIRTVDQGTDGCVIKAILPSDLWTFEGDLIVTIQREASGTKVEAATRIKGQYFDWGKSRRALNRLFKNLQEFTAVETPRES